MTNYRVFRISKRCHTHHDFSEVPPIVIPNLFRDPVFHPIEGRLFPAFSGFFFLSVQRLSRPRCWNEFSMTRRAGYRLQGMRSREENRQSIQGFNATEEVIPTWLFGSPSHCHPELVSGSILWRHLRWWIREFAKLVSKEHGAETSSDGMRRFKNNHTLSSWHALGQDLVWREK